MNSTNKVFTELVVNNNKDTNIITNGMSNTASSISNRVIIPLSIYNNNSENLSPNASNNVVTPYNVTNKSPETFSNLLPNVSNNLITDSNIAKKQLEPFSNLNNIPYDQLTRKQKQNRRTNRLKILKKLKNSSTEIVNSRSKDWGFMCDRKAKNQKCSNSCAGSEFLEVSVDGIYPSDSYAIANNYGPLDNGEYEVDKVSVVTNDHGKFRTYWKGYNAEEYTIEPRAHLRNAPIAINAGIDRYNESRIKNRFKRKRAVVPDVDELLEIKKLQCEICGKRQSTEDRMKFHKDFCHNNS